MLDTSYLYCYLPKIKNKKENPVSDPLSVL